MPTELSDSLADRYAEFAEILAEVDLAALDAKIARLQKLRAVVAAIGGMPTTRLDPPAREPRPHGFWPEYVYQTLVAAGPGAELTTAQMHKMLADALPNDKQKIYSAACNDRDRIERVFGSDPIRFRLRVAGPQLAAQA